MFQRIIASAVNYAIYNELGTRRMAARPFLAPAVEAYRQRLQTAWRELLRVR